MLEALVRRPLVSSPNPPLLILLHGLGADEHDLMGLGSELDPRLLIVTLRAPMKCEFGGYAWFDVRWDVNGVQVDPEQALESRNILVECLETLPAELHVEPSHVFLGGFSQGAMMSLGVSASTPKGLSGVLLLSGRLLPEFVEGELAPEFATVPFLVQHGTLDPVLPITGGREVNSFLVKAGCKVTYHEYEMAHEISMESLSDIRNWLSDRLSEPGLA